MHLDPNMGKKPSEPTWGSGSVGRVLGDLGSKGLEVKVHCRHCVVTLT